MSTLFSKTILGLAFCFLANAAFAQSFFGAGFGTFNIPGAINKFRGTGPTVKYEYITGDQRQSVYADLSFFSKRQQGDSRPVYDASGNLLGSAETEITFSYIYTQLGFKKLFVGDADERKVLPYTGGGIALVFANSATRYESNVSAFPEEKVKRFIFGFHFNAGLQYNLKAVILELRGNLDIDLKPLVNDGASDVSNVLTNLRLSVLIPITK